MNEVKVIVEELLIVEPKGSTEESLFAEQDGRATLLEQSIFDHREPSSDVRLTQRDEMTVLCNKKDADTFLLL